MEQTREALGLTVYLKTDYDTAMKRVGAALKNEGFGVLTEIDVRETLKTKLAVDFRRYAILGACNPPLAYRALQADADIGLWLPCNVPVDEISVDETKVSLTNPLIIQTLFGNPDIAAVAEEAYTRLM